MNQQEEYNWDNNLEMYFRVKVFKDIGDNNEMPIAIGRIKSSKNELLKKISQIIKDSRLLPDGCLMHDIMYSILICDKDFPEFPVLPGDKYDHCLKTFQPLPLGLISSRPVSVG